MNPPLLTSSGSQTAAFVVAATILLAGCGGSDHGRVTGRVVQAKGAPLAGANVIARSDETGKTSHGTTDADGNYELSTTEPGDGTPPGTYKVVITEVRGDPDAIQPPTIADKYSDPAQSGLTFTIAAGEDKTFDVTVDPP
jgi:hypothetical protein